MIAIKLMDFYSRILNRCRILKFKLLGCSIGKNCSIGKISVIGHYRIRIGNNVTIADNVRLNAPYNNITSSNFSELNQPTIVINDNVFIGYGCVIEANKLVNIKEYCMLGPYVFITDSNHIHHLSSELFRYLGGTYKPVIIKQNCWIGSQSNILLGVTIEENSIIAANSTVIRDIERNTLNAGSPSQIKKRK